MNLMTKLKTLAGAGTAMGLALGAKAAGVLEDADEAQRECLLPCYGKRRVARRTASHYTDFLN